MPQVHPTLTLTLVHIGKEALGDFAGLAFSIPDTESGHRVAVSIPKGGEGAGTVHPLDGNPASSVSGREKINVGTNAGTGWVPPSSFMQWIHSWVERACYNLTFVFHRSRNSCRLFPLGMHVRWASLHHVLTCRTSTTVRIVP